MLPIEGSDRSESSCGYTQRKSRGAEDRRARSSLHFVFSECSKKKPKTIIEADELGIKSLFSRPVHNTGKGAHC